MLASINSQLIKKETCSADDVLSDKVAVTYYGHSQHKFKRKPADLIARNLRFCLRKRVARSCIIVSASGVQRPAHYRARRRPGSAGTQIDFDSLPTATYYRHSSMYGCKLGICCGITI